MKPDVPLQAMFDRFMEGFALPLVRGGDVVVSYPIGPGSMRYFHGAEPTQSRLALDLADAREAVATQFVPHPAGQVVDHDDLALLAALHNLMLCSHHEVTTGWRGQARWDQCVAWSEEYLAETEPCASPQQALRRHCLLHNLFRLRREDTVVRNWRRVRRFAGQAPPRRSFFWSRVRQVHAQKTTVELDEVLPVKEAQRLFTGLVERSPLTCLTAMPYALHADVYHEPFRWTDAVVMVLSQPELCRAVTYEHLQLGLSTVGPTLVGGVTADLAQQEANAEDQRRLRLVFALRYLINLQLTHCWLTPQPELTAPLSEDWPIDIDDPSRSIFFGWLAAALDRPDRFGAPPAPAQELQHRERLYRNAAARVAAGQLDEAARQLESLWPRDTDSTDPEGESP